LRIKDHRYINQIKVYIRTYLVWYVSFGVYWSMTKLVAAK